MQFEIVEKIATVAEYQSLRRAVGWQNHAVDMAEKSLANSIFTVCAISENKVIGFGRVVGDGHIYFYLQDVIVSPEYQGQGIGYKITEKLNDLILSVAQSGAYIGLMAAENASGLYEKFGFTRRPENAPGLDKRIP